MRRPCALAVILVAAAFSARAGDLVPTPIEPLFFREAVTAGALPPVAQRLPQDPAVVSFDQPWMVPGQEGGELRMLVGQARDTRLMVAYSYARLVGYDLTWDLVPDILAAFEVEDGRVFTFHIRRGHRWSDGAPFTSADFLYWWQDVANNPELAPMGLAPFLRVDGKAPRVEAPDPWTVRYTWDNPNPYFLPALAGARPEFIFQPAHYLKQFHAAYADPQALAARVKAEGRRDWAALHRAKAAQYQDDNPELPTLDPWRPLTAPPASRFVFERNPYFFRIDAAGHQLPYIDRASMTVTNTQLIPVKTASGDADLQARGLSFDNYTVLKQGEKRNHYNVRLWQSARGAEMALFPNLSIVDPVWRAVFRNADVRRALSLAINRREVNQVVFFGLADPGNDTILPSSPLFESAFATRFATFDLNEANRLLDGAGLARGADGLRRLSDGRPMDIVVETAGEDPTQVAILQLIADTWREAGVRLLIKPEQRDVLRNRVFAGQAQMSVWSGLENGIPTAATPPVELAPTSQQQLCWPKWGQWVETDGKAGEPVDLPAAQELVDLLHAWEATTDDAARRQIWQRMLTIRADQAFSIGVVRGVPQPVVVSGRLRNVPEKGVYNWDPGAFFGVYHPDTFWFDDAPAMGGGR